MKDPILIDTHAHLDLADYAKDRKEIIDKAKKDNLWVVNVGVNYKSSQEVIKLAKETGFFAAIGLHPACVLDSGSKEEGIEEFDFEKYQKLAQDKNVVAIGEIGLDYFDGKISEKAKNNQMQALFEQLELAQRIQKPIFFHCRKAYDDLLGILAMFNHGCSHCPHACASGLKGTIHSFMGRWSQAEKFLEMGLYLSFNGVITYAKDYDKVIENTPLDRILVETDCPYLTPVPYRGERNEPSYVKYVASRIAEIKKISFEEVAKQTTKNARELLSI